VEGNRNIPDFRPAPITPTVNDPKAASWYFTSRLNTQHDPQIARH
jgi:hypothetical protein